MARPERCARTMNHVRIRDGEVLSTPAPSAAPIAATPWFPSRERLDVPALAVASFSPGCW